MKLFLSSSVCFRDVVSKHRDSCTIMLLYKQSVCQQNTFILSDIMILRLTGFTLLCGKPASVEYIHDFTVSVNMFSTKSLH